MNGICGNSNEQKMEIEHIKCEGTLIREEKEIANKFNEYFTGVGKLYAEKIDSPNEFEEVDISQCNSFYLTPVDPMEIQDTISQLKSGKAAGHDSIRSETLKEIKSEISEPLTYLVNSCFENGCFPDAFKLGIISQYIKAATVHRSRTTDPSP